MEGFHRKKADGVETGDAPPGRPEAVLFQTHLLAPPLEGVLDRLVQEAGNRDVYVLFDTGSGNPVPSIPHADTHPYSSRDVAAAFGVESLFPGYWTLAAVDFWKRNQHYTCYWVIEYDVRFTGPWSLLFDHFVECDDDLITAHLRTVAPDSNWHWRESVQPPEGGSSLDRLVAGFLPVTRYSNRALGLLADRYSAGWRGHQEILVPTLLNDVGYGLRDLGGSGAYVEAGDRNRFYVAPPGEDLVEDRRVWRLSTFRWRPAFRVPGRRRGKLYHPVKPEGWDEGHLRPVP